MLHGKKMGGIHGENYFTLYRTKKSKETEHITKIPKYDFQRKVHS